jgi:guanylate kinase
MYVFIATPSFEALEARLRGRKTESEEDLRR